MSSSDVHIDEAVTAVASAVARLQHRLQQEDGDDLAATMTIAIQAEDRACNCEKDRDVAVIKLPGDSGPCSDGGEVQLVAKYLLMILKKQGMLNQVSQVCCECTFPTTAAPVSGGHCDNDEDSEAATEQEKEGEQEDEAEQQEQDVKELEEESLEEEDDDEDEDEEVQDFVREYHDFDELQRRVTLDLSHLSRQGPKDMTSAKVCLLAPHMLRPVRKLINLSCDVDSAWALQLLYDLAPQLEELQMSMPSRAHLEVMETMPQLSRLDVEYYDDGIRQCDGSHGSQDTKTGTKFYVFKRPSARHCGLKFLKVGHMPKTNVFSLVRAHRRTLEELWLTLGTGNSPVNPGVPEENQWPESCHDLHRKLGRFAGEWPLMRLVLYRWLYLHNEDACLVQVHAIRQVLPGVNVQCYICDKVTDNNF